jgi:hypothetical protein
MALCAAAMLASAALPRAAQAGFYCWSGHVYPFTSTTSGMYAGSALGGLQTAEPNWGGGNHPWCGSRFQIERTDGPMYSMVMAAWLSGKRIGMCYSDEAGGTLTAHGGNNASCKVYHTYPVE